MAEKGGSVFVYLLTKDMCLESCGQSGFVIPIKRSGGNNILNT